MPREANFELFEALPQKIYPAKSQRFVFGNDPVEENLTTCFVLIKDEKEVLGRFAFYENPALKYQNKSAAALGSYECVEDEKASQFLIQKAIDFAKSKGYDWLIAPMENSTWNNYRFSLNNDFPNFFLEPYHHIYYNNQFLNSGFQVIANYFSNEDKSLNFDDKKLQKLEQYYLKKGAIFRKINPKDYENEFSRLADFCLENFSDNFLFTPISKNRFVEKYKSIQKFINPNLVWLVENQDSELQAFVFCTEDFANPQTQTLIIKSIAGKQKGDFKGVATYLATKIMQFAKQNGFQKIVHAFMIQGNSSLKSSLKYAESDYKKYALYAKLLNG